VLGTVLAVWIGEGGDGLLMDETLVTDASLLARIAQRDPQALEALYERHAKQVFSLALAILGNRVKAADLTQEVFLLVWRHAGIYRPTGEPRAWLLRLTRNRAIDELRRERRRPQGNPVFAEKVLRSIPAPSTVAETIEHQEVREAVAALPETQREALNLAFFHGLSHQEIATLLRTPLGTVKARIRRALQTLREQWQA
jgi:RNA polymerase sigma-70 factor (ECF subfamily)